MLFVHVPRMEQPRDRLARARAEAGYDSPTAAAKAFPRDINKNTLISHENGNRAISRQAAATYARLFNVTAGWILYGDTAKEPGDRQRGVRLVRVGAHVQAGYWAETWEWTEDEQYEVAVPDEPQLAAFKLFAAETRGPSMNRRWPERTVVVFTDVDETHESPTPGKRYVVQRLRPDGQREHTVKLLHRDEGGKLWLIPESTDPLFQAPISLEDGTGDEDIVAIIGRVHFVVTRE